MLPFLKLSFIDNRSSEILVCFNEIIRAYYYLCIDGVMLASFYKWSLHQLDHMNEVFHLF